MGMPAPQQQAQPPSPLGQPGPTEQRVTGGYKPVDPSQFKSQIVDSTVFNPPTIDQSAFDTHIPLVGPGRVQPPSPAGQSPAAPTGNASYPLPPQQSTATQPQSSVTQPAQPNIFQQSAGAYTDALGTTRSAINAMASQPTTIAQNMGRYANPYEDQVVQNTLKDIERARKMQINQVGANATSAGAFGGSRQGVAESLTNKEALDQAAKSSAMLRQQGFNQAGQFAGQDVGNMMRQQANMLAAGSQMGSLSNLGFGMGRQLNQDQMAVGNQQQALQQAIMNAARGQFNQYSNQPNQSLQALISALSGQQNQGSQTNTMTPGLFDIISAGASLFPG